jgi:hypothetical protein
MITKHSIPALLSAVILSCVTACQNSPILIDTELKDITLSQPDSTDAIQFATFANRSTRTVPTISDLEFYHPTFKVYGTKTSNEGTKVQPIFEGVTVTANIVEGEEPNTWTYNVDRYWDKQADYYQFVAFAPAHAPIAYKHNLVEVNHESARFFSPNDYTLIGQNLMEGAPAAAEKNTGFTGNTDQEGNAITDCDVMRSAPFPVTDPKTTPVVTLNFSHTLAKLLVTIKANASTPYIIYIDNLTISGLHSTGAYDHANGWETTGTNTVDYKYTTPIQALSASAKTYFIESLLMPQNITASQVLTLNYTVTSGTYSEQFTYTATLADLFKDKATGYKGANSYTINFNIAPEKNIITFDTGITPWEEDDNNTSLEY